MYGSLIRLSPLAPGEPPRKARHLPHGPEVIAEVRRLIEATTLSYRAIAARTGVPRATISRHLLEQGWLRPLADREDVPASPAAQRRARRGELAARLLRAAEYRVEQVTMNPTASSAAFAQAARLLALVQRLEPPDRPRRRVPLVARLKREHRERP